MNPSSKSRQRIFTILLVVLTSILAFLSGYGFQIFLTNKEPDQKNYRRSLHEQLANKRNFEFRDRSPADLANEDMMYHQIGLKQVRNDTLKEFLRYFTKEPHLAGTPIGKKQAEHVKREWDKYGFDKVEIKKYDVLLSYPSTPASVTVQNPDGKLIYTAKTVEEPFFEEERSNLSVYPFNAYSASGDVEGEYVYVNYGNVKDYLRLAARNISVMNKVVIVKYGTNFRGEKVRIAEKLGAIGVILYGDPSDTNDPGAPTYPFNWNAPAGSIPRGNIANVKGDPLTPKYPSKEGMHRIRISDVTYFTKIPVQPISFHDAEQILGFMDGDVYEPEWDGGLNITYRIISKTPRTIRLIVNNPKEVRPIYNVVATIKGDIEPDRIILVGNHRDAWVFGGGDPSSGTAVLMETARVISTMLAEGWRPRRTIMLCSWDAEEYGLMGSIEWAQEFYSVLSQRAVVYLNVDIAVSGTYTFRAKSSPSIIDKMFDISKATIDPDYINEEAAKRNLFVINTNLFENEDPKKKEKSLFSNWRDKLPNQNNPTEPRYSDLESGSDYVYFYSVIGIPSIDFRYSFNEKAHPKRSQYPVYHTIYDNFYYMTTFVDPDMRYHATITKLWLQFALEMADDQLLKFNLTRYAKKILKEVDLFEIAFRDMLEPQKINMDLVKASAEELVKATENFHNKLEDLKLADSLSVRRANDQMMAFERALIVQEGILDRPDSKHVIYSPVRNSLFKTKAFPALLGILYNIEVEKRNEWHLLEEQISVLVDKLNNARNLLNDYAII
ncbi:N-acetylated-alpha-linked acidic dipeptidase 2 isoform X1 [Hydra vulgaris]|uniref:N-acetylated-alpha-linked acidic dipeptidase 2 isoform X1 n=1 Tax=Hydra vulgaris TaxID=6087 RepID=UPI001F5E79FB|nr:N-acetylated-alpha-linked acidic dipeptidase 2 isoform X1 [Hydra vulgaris]XP_047135575.1 N-acetylated-alpha-linked acidic dipeptidase 2 isoform X2 [Hydra vulgaris]